MDLSTLAALVPHASLLGFVSVSCGMAAWREKHPATVAASREVIDAARRAANLQQKEMAADLDMDEGHLSRALRDGGNFAALVVLGIRHPVFGAALMSRLGELLRGASESPVERYERLIADLHNLPSREPVKCDGADSGSSVVPSGARSSAG